MDREARAASLILFLGILLATIQNGITERRIVCYYTNWSVYRPGTAKFSPQNINPYLCTHLVYAFGGFTKDNALRPFDKYQDIEKGGYAKFTGLKTYNKNLKTMLAIGGWNEGSSRFSPMVADPARRREFVRNAIKFLRQNHFDGLDLDWEYPAFRDGGKPRDKDNYANLVQELRQEFERESSKTGRPRLLLSMAMPAGIEYIDKGYDVPRLNDHLDFINLLSYDYHSAYEPAVNHHSPLYPLEEDNEYNYDAELTIDYTINHLLEKGASADKIVLGIPTYGRSYTLFNQDATELGSPADGPGDEGEATREKGYLAYYEICEGIAESEEWEVVQPNPDAMGPYAFKGNQWVGYDDEDIVKLKARYVNEKKLGGIMFWSIDNDDFRGKCHGRAYPLIEAAKEALLAENRNTIDKTKSVDSRKKTRTQSAQSNAIARKLVSSSRRSSTTTAPITKKRGSSPRPKYRTVTSRSKDSDEEDREVSRRSYDPPSDEEIEGRNTLRVTEKTERPRNRGRNKTRSGSNDRGSRRKQSRRKGPTKTDESGESLSNKLTTPEPPTTPDPGTDFKCEDEGFFSHPRDCKKYFWCLDSGPGGLGVVAHQFTCPSGLVFNKAADSCDYPRNVICPKSKTSVASTTRAPITAATSRTTYLHSTTTAKAESEEEYDEEEEEEEEDYDEDESEEEAVSEEPKITTTAKPLVYKTLTRNRSTTTTTTTTTTSKPNEPERAINIEDEEDPRVIKELIDLIKKAGGIEQLERQLLFQERNSDATSGSESVTPATISRSLYERVLSRQANKIGSQRPALSSSGSSYVNGPGRAQFEGLDDIPEVKSLRRSQKPQYVTIERPKSAAKEFTSENEDIEEDIVDDVASLEEQGVSNPLESRSSTQRVTPNYVNIRRARPSTTTSRNENDVEGKEIEIEEERSTRRRRPSFSSKQQDNESNSETSKSSRNRGSSFRNAENSGDTESPEKDDNSSTAKSRYISIQRFRSTTSKTEDTPSAVPLSDPTSETASPARIEEYPEVSSTTASTTTSSTTVTPTISTSTEIITVISVEPPENPSSVSATIESTGPTVEPVKLVEDSATEILLTTVPASGSSQSTTTSATRTTIATVSQPRPFGFARRRPGSSEAATTTTTTIPSSNQARSKVADTKAIRLPTLKELIGYPTTYDRTVTTPSVLLHLLRFDVDNDISQQNVEEPDALEDARELVQPSGDKIEEIGDSWLLLASENIARSRSPKRKDITFSEYGASVTNSIHEDENGRSQPSTSVYLRPTTMRGIPLASLTPSSMTRGFYVTRNENDLSTSRAANDFTLTESPAELRTETTLIPDVSTTGEIVTVAFKDRNGSKTDAPNDNANNTINDEEIDTGEAKFSIFSPSAISSRMSDEVENDVITNPASDPASKRGKSLRVKIDRDTTPPPNGHATPRTTETRRAIALAVSKYNELVTPLWSGKRIVVRKRNRPTVSPIKDNIRQKESGFTRTTTSLIRGSSVTSTTTSTFRRTLSAIPTPPTVFESTIPAETSNVYSDLVSSTGAQKTEDSRNRAITEATMTSMDSMIAAISPITTIASTASDPGVISTITDDLATATTPAITDPPTITTVPSTVAVAAATETIATTTLAMTRSPEVESTSAITDYIVAAIPTTAYTRAYPTDPANMITPASNRSGTNSTVADYSVIAATATDSTVTTTPASTSAAETTSAIVNHSAVAIPTTTSTNAVATDSANTATYAAASTESEISFTFADYPTVAISAIANDSVTATVHASTRTENVDSSTQADYFAVTIPTGASIHGIANDPTTDTLITTTPVTVHASTRTENEDSSTLADYFAVTIPTGASIHGIANDPTTDTLITTTPATTNTEDEITIANYSMIAMRTTTSTREVTTDSTIATTLENTSTEVDTTSNIASYFAVAETSATTTSSLTTIVSPTADTRPNADAFATMNNLADADTTTTNVAATSAPVVAVIVPTASDPSLIPTPGDANIPSKATSAVTDSSTITTDSETTSANADSTSTGSTAPSTLGIESSRLSFTAPSILDIDSNTESFGTATAEFARTTEISKTFETIPTLISTTTAISRSLPSTNAEKSSAATTASFIQNDGTVATPTNAQTPSTLLSVTIPTTNTATLTSEKSTVLSITRATARESITTNAISRTTASAYKPATVRTTDRESIVPEVTIDPKGTTSRITRTRTRDRTIPELDTTGYQYGRRTSGRTATHRRVINQPIEPTGRPATRQPTEHYPRRRITVYRGRPRGPSNTSSSRVIEENLRRRIAQRRVRVNSEAASSTIRSDESIVDLQNTTEKKITYGRAGNVARRIKVVSKGVKGKVEEKETTTLTAEETTVFIRLSNSTDESLRNHHVNGKTEGKRKFVMEGIKSEFKETFATRETNDDADSSNEKLPGSSQNNPHVSKSLPKEEEMRKRMKVVLKSVKPVEKSSTVDEMNVNSNSTDGNLQGGLSSNLHLGTNFSYRGNTRRRMRVVLKDIRLKSKEEESTIEKVNADFDFTNESLQGKSSNNIRMSKNLSGERKTRRRMRVVLKSVRPKSKAENSTTEKVNPDPDPIDRSLQGNFLSNYRMGKNLSDEKNIKRRMRVVLKRVRSKSKEENSTIEKVSIDSDSADETHQTESSTNPRMSKNFSREKNTSRRMRVVLKSVRPKSEERNSAIEEESTNPDSTDKDLQGDFSSNLYLSDDPPDEDRIERVTKVALKGTRSKLKEEETATEKASASSASIDESLDDLSNVKGTMIFKLEEGETRAEHPEGFDAELNTTETSIRVEEDTDRPSNEVNLSKNDGGSINRRLGIGHSNRQRKQKTQSTTVAPLINTPPSSVSIAHRRGRPAVDTTLSSRIDLVDALEGTEPYVKLAGVENDQRADVSDQSIRAQEFAVTLADPPSSSSDIASKSDTPTNQVPRLGRTPLRDAVRRKISTTVAPRTDSTTTIRTVTRYGADFRNQQRTRTKERPTVNATIRPRKPPVVDYDYYEDEVPIVLGKSALNSKLFLTSKGTIRCLDQGNFPHPYSCRKFITCARMVNGQVIGTEYTCPDKLSFDPVGGICNWSAGLGCKD